MDNVRILFVLSSKCSQQSEASETMIQAFDECKQNTSNVTWIISSELDSVTLNKTDFVVFDEFEGDAFERSKESKSARILGPWAIRVCLMESKPIPNYPWPIYNVAMYNNVITCSGLSKTDKLEIKRKVESMGGCYEDNLVAKTTHLVTLKAKSEKYFTATESGLKIMRPSWINDVWQVSQSVNVDADSESFYKHRCSAFEGLTICTTGLTVVERKNAEKLIRENGGTFTGNLVLASTDVLCCGPNSTSSNKYKAARQEREIKCVNLSWLTDSVHKGYALRHSNYQMQKFTSTPTKSDTPVNPDYSVLSAIGQPDFSLRVSVEDTMAAPSTPTKLSTNKRKANMKAEYKELIDNLDIKKAKMAGQYLDGLSVYLTGFSPEHTEKLNKILNFSGATRNDKFSDRITHVVVGDPRFHEVNVIKNKGYSCVLVSVQWLLQSIDKGRPVNEEEYLISMSDMDRSGLGSPLSKKGLNLLRSNRTVTEKEIEVDVNNVSSNIQQNIEPDIVQQYLKSNNGTQEDTLAKLLEGMEDTNFSKQGTSEPQKMLQYQPRGETSTQQSSMTVTQDKSTEISRIFENLKFLVLGFDDDEYNHMKEKIEEFSGELVCKNYKGVPDFAVLPIFNKLELHHTASEVINNLFIHECDTAEKLVSEILYYHRPFDILETKTLENCVITISSYSGYERIFLKTLIEVLGGVAQEQFARVTSQAKGVVASTHLVSPVPVGKKYEAALKWKLPVVTNQWLLECARTGKRVSEEDYLLEGLKDSKNEEENSAISTQLKESSANQSKTGPTTSAAIATPTRVLTPSNHATPLYKRFKNSSEIPFSPVTPVNKIMKNFNENIQNTSVTKETEDYSLPRPWMNIKTPKTPLGACLTPNPSPGLRKQWEYWLQKFPDKSMTESNTSTPLSEIKRQLWNKILHRDNAEQPDFNESQGANAESEVVQEDSNPKTPENQHLANKLQQLEDMLSASGGGKRHSRNFQATIPVPTGNREYQDSQPCTVGWDFRQEEPIEQSRIFSLSGIADDETRAQMVTQIEMLGGTVSELTNYDPACTHLLCPKPARNEKSLACMAAGKWVLHISYLVKSVEAGKFLNEEEYEFGNPKAVGMFAVGHDRETDRRMQQMHWWRREISRRGYGAFNDMRAILVAQKKEPIARVIEAGGGFIIDVRPPFDDTVHATHCLLEQKTVKDFTDYIPLARQGIYLLNTVYISDYLHDPNKDIRDCILPYFAKYYTRS